MSLLVAGDGASEGKASPMVATCRKQTQDGEAIVKALASYSTAQLKIRSVREAVDDCAAC